MSRIETLTPEQERRLKEWHAEWFAVGCSTEPADRPRAERAITAMYARIDEPAPAFVWCDGPATAILFRDLFLDEKKLSSLESSLGSSLESSLGSSLRSSLRSSLWSSLGSSLWSSLGTYFYGQTASYWLAFYRFPRDVLGVQYDAQKSKDLNLWCEVARSCDWWWPFKGLCLVSERPELVRWEPNRTPARLHCADGPALRYRDGWEVHALCGVRVPPEYFTEPLTPQKIRSERNAEVRRVLIAKYGEDKYLTELGAETVHKDKDSLGQPRRLLKLPARGNLRGELWVRVMNSSLEPDGSRKPYMLRVHQECRPFAPGQPLGQPQELTCRNAVASTFYLRGEEYRPEVET